MKKDLTKISIRGYSLWSALSGLLWAMGCIYPTGIFSFFCLVPLIVVLNHIPGEKVFKCSLAFGLAFAIPILFWMPMAVWDFTEGNFPATIMLYLIAILMLAFILIVPVVCSHWIIRKGTFSLLSVFTIAGVWCLWEFLCTNFLSGIPWIQVGLHKTILQWNSPLQIAVFGGSSLLSFFICIINVLISFYWIQKSSKMLWTLGGLATIWIGLVVFAYALYPLDESKQNPVKIAVLNENTAANLKWTEQNGNALVQNLFALNHKAISLNPDMILWSESSVPWTFLHDDQFLQQIIKDAGNGKIKHLIGINSDFSNTEIYNSAYYLQDSFHFQRYDKRFLLTIAENLPSMFSGLIKGGGVSVKEGDKNNIFKTELGDFAVMICMETLVSQAASSLVKEGAGYFLVISNDGWVKDSRYIVLQHFLSTRLRAIENRKEMIVNSNQGISGKIAADGSIEASWQSEKGEVKLLHIHENKIITFYTKYDNLFVYIYTLFILFFIIVLNLKKNIA